MARLRVGVIGCGLVAQVMHLHYLRELADRFEIAALCDISPELRHACAQDYGVADTYVDWRDLLRARLDAVLILTSGSHAPIAIAAAEAGLHILVEKPMCFSVDEGRAMIAAAERAGVTLMVAYNKRYDPAYLRLAKQAKDMRDLRLLRVTIAARRPMRASPPGSKATMPRVSPLPLARSIRYPAAHSTWSCSTAWCTSSTPCGVCSVSRMRWSSRTSGTRA